MEQMREALDALLAAIRTSEEYKNYQDIKARIHEKPEVEKRVAEFRKRNYQLQNQKDADLFGEMDKLEREKSKICENSLAAEYLCGRTGILPRHSGDQLGVCRKTRF